MLVRILNDYSEDIDRLSNANRYKLRDLIEGNISAEQVLNAYHCSIQFIKGIPSEYPCIEGGLFDLELHKGSGRFLLPHGIYSYRWIAGAGEWAIMSDSNREATRER